MATSALPAAANRHRHGQRLRGWARLRRALVLTLATLLALFFVFPFAWSMLASIRPAGEAMREPLRVIPSALSLQNYETLGTYGAGIWNYFGNSLYVTAISIIGTVFLSTLAGYGFSRFRFRFKNALFVMILATLMIPFPAILVPLFLVLNATGMTNSLTALAFLYITFQLPFGIFMMRNAFDAVPREIEEAAIVDGTSSFGALWRVMLPLVLPAIATVVVFTFLAAWNEFLAALIFLRETDKFTLPILINSVVEGQFGMVDWGAVQAGVTVAAVPAIAVFLILQRFYVKGLVQGAVKG